MLFELEFELEFESGENGWLLAVASAVNQTETQTGKKEYFLNIYKIYIHVYYSLEL